MHNLVGELMAERLRVCVFWLIPCMVSLPQCTGPTAFMSPLFKESQITVFTLRRHPAFFAHPHRLQLARFLHCSRDRRFSTRPTSHCPYLCLSLRDLNTQAGPHRALSLHHSASPARWSSVELRANVCTRRFVRAR